MMSGQGNDNKPYKNIIEEIEAKKKIEKLENELLQDPYFLAVKDMSVDQIMDQMKEAYMANGREIQPTKLLTDSVGVYEEIRRLKKKQEAAKIGRSII